MSHTTLTELLKHRATIRKYTHQDIDQTLLDELLEMAARTQTMGNLQLYSVVVTRSEEGKQRLLPIHFNQPMVGEAPVVLTICADFRRVTHWCQERQANPGYDNMLSFMNAASDALLYTQTLSTLAEAKGLGVCYLGTTIYQCKALIDQLHLPQLVMPIATLTLGWPAEKPSLSDRLPLEGFVHNEVYQDYTAEIIDRIYTPKEQLPENQHFVAINEKQTLAQVFTDLRYRKSDNEVLSDALLTALTRQGFLKEEVEVRPTELDCDVVRFQNKKEKWVAFVGLKDGRPYEIFTGLMDDEEGIVLPKSVTNGKIIKSKNPDGTTRYDFQFKNRRGYKTTVEGLSGKFNKEYWNYAKLISGILRYHMPLKNVLHLVGSLSLDDENINTWKVGVERALKKYLPDYNESTENEDNN